MHCIASSRMFLDFVGSSRIDRYARPKYFFHVTQRYVLDNSTVKCCIVFYLECSRTFCVALYCTAYVEMYGDVRYGVRGTQCSVYDSDSDGECHGAAQHRMYLWSYPHAHVCERYSFSNNWTAATTVSALLQWFYLFLLFSSLLYSITRFLAFSFHRQISWSSDS